MMTKSVACPQYCSALPVIRCTLPVPCRGAAKCTAGQWGQCPQAVARRPVTALVPCAATRVGMGVCPLRATWRLRLLWDSDGLPITVRTCTRSRRRGRALDGCSDAGCSLGRLCSTRISEAGTRRRSATCRAAVMTVCVNWLISGNLQGSNNRLLARRGATKCLREDRVGRQHDEQQRRFKDRRIPWSELGC
jgi:hypothetical protein